MYLNIEFPDGFNALLVLHNSSYHTPDTQSHSNRFKLYRQEKVRLKTLLIVLLNSYLVVMTLRTVC